VGFEISQPPHMYPLSASLETSRHTFVISNVVLIPSRTHARTIKSVFNPNPHEHTSPSMLCFCHLLDGTTHCFGYHSFQFPLPNPHHLSSVVFRDPPSQHTSCSYVPYSWRARPDTHGQSHVMLLVPKEHTCMFTITFSIQAQKAHDDGGRYFGDPPSNTHANTV